MRPFVFHGIDLSRSEGEDEAIGECPFCGKIKLSVNVATGQWHCKVCDSSGNAVSFLQKLWTESETSEEELHPLAEERSILDASTLHRWGVRKSLVSGEWILPGWGTTGKLTQLYRWVPLASGKSVMLPTPKVETEQEHGLFGLNLFDKKKKRVRICEGPWDGMSWWELEGKRVNVIAVPGCNVFLPSWASILDGKEVSLCYDNDHPKVVCKSKGCRTTYPEADGKCPKCGSVEISRRIEPPAWAAMREVSALLLRDGRDPSSVRVLRWSAEGDHDPELKAGWDVRDSFSQRGERAGRLKVLDSLCSKLSDVPKEWIERAKESEGSETIECSSWSDLIDSWSKAMRWRTEMDDVLSVMLAVAASTELPGDQLFLQVIADAGSGKTRLCDAMLTSPKCYPLEHLTGFHSGWKDKEGNDYSLIGRINYKCLITPEADTLLSSPNFQEIMSQQRRIFDGTSGSSYKNQKEDKRYTGLRTPWIMVGTPILLSSDQSRLGDRFLKVMIRQPSLEEKRKIVWASGNSQLSGLLGENNGHVASPLKLKRAYGKTGGYINRLRSKIAERIASLKVDRDALLSECALLAEFVADLRARPDPNAKRDVEKESLATKELPTRLVQQLVRLSCCLAVVLGRDSPDVEVMRRVRKVAEDSCQGRTLNVVRHLHRLGTKGATVSWLEAALGDTHGVVVGTVKFLRSIDVVRLELRKSKNGMRERPRWVLTERMRELCDFVLGSPETG